MVKIMNFDTLQQLVSSRWLIPAMALAVENEGIRVAPLTHRLGTSRSMTRRVVARLVELGWLISNAGHGHPLRPEFVATAAGKRIGEWCSRVMVTRRELKLEPVELGRWALPVVLEVGCEWRRFSEFEQALEPITPRALSQTLKQLIGLKLIDRQLRQSFPPIAIYGATERGRSLAEAAR